MTPRDRLRSPPGRREGAGDAPASARLFDALRRAAETTGTAVPRDFWTASRTTCDARASRHRTLLAKSRGRPSLGVIIYAPRYWAVAASN